MTENWVKRIANPNPVRAAVAGIFVYLSILLLSPTTITHPIEAGPLVFVILCYVMFFCGAALAIKAKIGKVGPLYYAKGRRRQRMYLAAIGILSIVSFSVDRLFLRGASLSGNFLDNREALLEAASTPFGVLGALLLPATYLYLFEVYRARNAGQIRSRRPILLGIILLLAHPMIGLLFGSRSTLLSSLLFLAAISLYFRQRPINWPLVLKLGLTIQVIFILFGIIFLQRLELMNMLPEYSAQYSVYAFVIQPNPSAITALEGNQENFSFVVFFSLLNFSQYYTHGLLELMYQVSHESEITHSNGAFLFYIPYKTAAMFVPLPDVFQIMNGAKVTVGAYTSFFGPVHSDFGWFAPLFMLIFGAYSMRFYRFSLFNPDYIPLSILLGSTAFLFPVVNFILLGPNFYILTGFLFFGPWNRWSYAKHRNKRG